MMNVFLICLTSSWRKRSDEKKSSEAGILDGSSLLLHEWTGVGTLQNGDNWSALYPVVMKMPAFLLDLPGPDKKKEQNKYSRYALKLSAELSSVTPPIQEKDAYGVPQPTHGIYWSVSYSNECVAAVVAPYAVGIDIERIRDVSAMLREQVASEAEWELSSGKDHILFFRYWTAKEAVLKALGKGLSGLDDCTVRQIIDDVLVRLNYHDTNWLVLQQNISANKRSDHSNYMAAVTLGHLDVVWQLEGVLAI